MKTIIYSAALQQLLREDRLNELGPGQPNRAAQALLNALTVDNAFAPFKVRDSAFAQACLAGLWLYHDYLDESHGISQDLGSAEGSYWHALMHRRELDFGNAKYWFRRVGKHPIFGTLSLKAAQLAAGAPQEATFLTRSSRWDPYAFVDLCEASLDVQAPCHPLCRQVQRVEWELLFAFCFGGAVGDHTQAQG